MPLFRSTQYFAKVLELAGIIVALVYEQLPSQSFKLRSGQYIKSLTGLSELSIATAWDKQYVIATTDAKLSLFWQTLYDYIQARTHDELKTAGALALIHTYLDKVVQDAKGDTTYPVFHQLQLRLAEDYLSDDPDQTDDSTTCRSLHVRQCVGRAGSLLMGRSGSLNMARKTKPHVSTIQVQGF